MTDKVIWIPFCSAKENGPQIVYHLNPRSDRTRHTSTLTTSVNNPVETLLMVADVAMVLREARIVEDCITLQGDLDKNRNSKNK